MTDASDEVRKIIDHHGLELQEGESLDGFVADVRIRLEDQETVQLRARAIDPIAEKVLDILRSNGEEDRRVAGYVFLLKDVAPLVELFEKVCATFTGEPLALFGAAFDLCRAWLKMRNVRVTVDVGQMAVLLQVRLRPGTVQQISERLKSDEGAVQERLVELSALQYTVDGKALSLVSRGEDSVFRTPF